MTGRPSLNVLFVSALARDRYHQRTMPRTTIDLDAPVLEELKRVQEEEGRSLGAVASSLLADALAARKKPTVARRLRWKSRSMGIGVAIEDKEALWSILDESSQRRRE
jgi:hypothetical protein